MRTYQLFFFILLVCFESSAAAPCPRSVTDGGIIQGRSGVYSCTIKSLGNRIYTAHTFRDDAALFSQETYEYKYAFDCKNEKTINLDKMEQGEPWDWKTPQPKTIAHKWLVFVCSNAKYFK